MCEYLQWRRAILKAANCGKSDLRGLILVICSGKNSPNWNACIDAHCTCMLLFIEYIVICIIDVYIILCCIRCVCSAECRGDNNYFSKNRPAANRKQYVSPRCASI